MQDQNNSVYSRDNQKQNEILNTIRKMLASSESVYERNQICLLIQVQVENYKSKIDPTDINYHRANNRDKISLPQSHAQDLNNESSFSSQLFQKQIKSIKANYPQYFNNNFDKSDNQSQLLIHLSEQNYPNQNEIESSVNEYKQDLIMQKYIQSNILSFSRVINNQKKFQRIINKIPNITQTSPIKQFSDKRDNATQIKYKRQMQEKLVQIQMLKQQKQSYKRLLEAQQIAFRDKSQQCENFKTRLNNVKGYLSQQKQIVKKKTEQNQQLKLQLSLKQIGQ